jgi:hypothetical protein
MILDGQRLYDEPIACDGLLIVGDPHVTSKRPGRRTDANWPDPVLNKLQACADVARERNLYPVFLGDLLDEPVERNEALKTRLIRILKAFPMIPLGNTGNHDIQNTALSDGDTLAMLAAGDNIDVANVSGPVCEFLVGGKRLGVGMTPYGQEIPRDVTGLFPEADAVLWFTHHNIAFEKSYPKAVEPFEILGCKLVVNGHIHYTQPPVRAGGTLWMNPGNIVRLSTDVMDHVPSAWILGGDGRMTPVELPHEKGVFDLTGRLVDAIHETELVREKESAFVTLLQAETTTDMARSSDGSLLREELEAKFERDNTPERIRGPLRALLTEAAQRRSAA